MICLTRYTPLGACCTSRVVSVTSLRRYLYLFWVHPCWGPLAGFAVFAPFRVFCLPLVRLLGIVYWGWVHPWWAAGVLLFSCTSGFTRVGVRWLVLLVVMPLLECSAWHSSDTCLVLYHGVGSTRVGRRACCCFRCSFRVAVRAAFCYLGQRKFYFKRYHLPAVFRCCFQWFGQLKFQQGITLLFLPPLPQGRFPFLSLGLLMYCGPVAAFTPCSSSHTIYIKV